MAQMFQKYWAYMCWATRLAKLSWLHVLQSDEVQRQHTPQRALVIPSEDDSIYDICRTDPLWTAPQGPSCIPPCGIVLELVTELHQGNGTRGPDVLESSMLPDPACLQRTMRTVHHHAIASSTHAPLIVARYAGCVDVGCRGQVEIIADYLCEDLLVHPVGSRGQLIQGTCRGHVTRAGVGTQRLT